MSRVWRQGIQDAESPVIRVNLVFFFLLTILFTLYPSAVITYTRLARNQASRYSCMNYGDVHMLLLLTEALLSVDEFWGRMQFSLRVITGRSTIFQHSPPPHHEYMDSTNWTWRIILVIKKRGEEVGGGFRRS